MNIQLKLISSVLSFLFLSFYHFNLCKLYYNPYNFCISFYLFYFIVITFKESSFKMNRKKSTNSEVHTNGHSFEATSRWISSLLSFYVYLYCQIKFNFIRQLAFLYDLNQAQVWLEGERVSVRYVIDLLEFFGIVRTNFDHFETRNCSYFNFPLNKKQCRTIQFFVNGLLLKIFQKQIDQETLVYMMNMGVWYYIHWCESLYNL